MSSLRQQILAAKDRPLREVVVPEWNATVYLKALGGAERARYEAAAVKLAKADEQSLAELHQLLVALALCDADGVRLFADTELNLIAEKNAAVIARLGALVQEDAAIGAAAVESAAGE